MSSVTEIIDILHITSAHPVTDTRIFVKEAQTLAREGYRVAIVGPGASCCREQKGRNLCIYSLPQPKSRFGRFSYFARSLYLFCVRVNPSVAHIHDPDLLLVAWFLKRRGIKVVYDVHEDFPKAVLSRAWIGPPAIRHAVALLVNRFERACTHFIDGFVLADTQLSKRFPESNSVVVRNFLDLSEWPKKLSTQPERSHHLRCIYVGDISEARGLVRMCNVIAEANAVGHNISLDLVGRASKKQQEAIATHPAGQNVTIHGWCSRSEVAKKLADADIAFCLLQPTPAYREALPVKILEYIASGLQVVATDLPRLQCEKLLKDALILVPWEAADATIANIILSKPKLAPIHRTEMRDIVEAHYNWSNEATRLVNFYKEIL